MLPLSEFIEFCIKHKDNFTWPQILKTLANENDSVYESFALKNINKIRGDIFEYICKYIIIMNGYTKCYLRHELKDVLQHKDITENVSTASLIRKCFVKDIGFDLFYVNKQDIFVGVQCKYSTNENKCINSNDIYSLEGKNKKYGVKCSMIMSNVLRQNPLISYPTIFCFTNDYISENVNNNLLKLILKIKN